jgi:alpha-glucosidase
VTWWRDGVLYQIYPRSFADSNGDGHGDLRGIIERLDHLAWLGVAGIWLNPTFPSPNDDWGYDVSDYHGVHPDFGTLEDLDELIAAAAERGIRVLLDLVPNHTSDRHPWFTERPDFYTWTDRPNNWVSIFDGGPAWSEKDGRYYLHLFLPSQPDLNWWNPEVADEFDEILRFWLDRGVAGFRIDVCQAIVKDRELRDDPGRSENQPEVHDVMRRWRAVADGYEDALLVGETYVYDLDALVRYYGDGADELHLGFNIPFIKAPLEAEPMRAIVEHMESHLPEGAWPVWTGSNHDAGRLATRWAGGDPDRVRLALVMLLTLRGTPFLYYGDEIGLTDGDVTDLRDKAGGRDGCRTPMPWVGQPGSPVVPWLPLHAPTTVEEQRADPGSILHLVRELIALRRGFVREPYERLESPPGTWVYRRGDHVVSLGFDADPPDGPGEVVLSTRHAVIRRVD